MFYEHVGDYIPLRIILKDVVGKHSVYRDKDNSNGAKGMGFKLDDDSLTKAYNIFEHIGEKKDISLSDFTYESKGDEYLKTKANDETSFREEYLKTKVNDVIPKENTKYACRALLQIHTIFSI